MTRLAALALAAALPVSAGLRICIVENGVERILSGAVTLPAIEVGAVQPLKFRVHIVGGNTRMDRFTVAGAEFAVTFAPTLPITVLNGAHIDLDAEFRPSLPGSGSGVLLVNQEQVLIVTQALPAPGIRPENGAALRAGVVTAFGDVELGSHATRTFVVENATGQRLTVTRLEVAGAAYTAPAQAVPFFLEPGESRHIEVTFEPQSEGRHGASLYLNSREFLLEGVAVMPPVSRPRLALEPATPRCGQQARIVVRLESAARWPVDGVLRMAFEGAADPAARLLAGDGRALPFRVAASESTARFGTSEAADFQTGTTAGRIIFTVELRSYREQLTFDLAPSTVEFDTLSALGASASIEIRFSAFDNTRTASALAFTFYDTAGRTIGRGPVRVDAAQDFRRYFDAATVGGVFALRAVFPVRGSVSKIGSVDVEVINIQGIARRNVKMTE